MEKEIQQILTNASQTSSVRIKLCLRGGRKVVKNAQSDPFASRTCNRTNCVVCSTPNSNGGCKQAGIGYQLSCNPCSDLDIESTYQGESSKSAFERGLQHAKGLIKKSNDNPIWKHSELHHQGDNKIPFTMSVTGRFAKPMVRQENEAIRIRESKAKYEMNSRSEFRQPVIIRLIPTSSNSQTDQTGTPATIMDPRRYNNKRKASEQEHPDSPHVQSRSKIARGPYYQSDYTNSTHSRHSRRDAYVEPNYVQSTRQSRNDTHSRSHSRSTSHNRQRYQSKSVVSRRSQSSKSTNNKHPNSHNTNHTHTESSRLNNSISVEFQMSPMPVRSQSPKNNHIQDEHVTNCSLSPVSPGSFSFAMRQLRSQGKFAFNTDQPYHSSKTISPAMPTGYKCHQCGKIFSPENDRSTQCLSHEGTSFYNNQFPNNSYLQW